MPQGTGSYFREYLNRNSIRGDSAGSICGCCSQLKYCGGLQYHRLENRGVLACQCGALRLPLQENSMPVAEEPPIPMSASPIQKQMGASSPLNSKSFMRASSAGISAMSKLELTAPHPSADTPLNEKEVVSLVRRALGWWWWRQKWARCLARCSHSTANPWW